MADSLIRHGQLLPIVVVADAEPRWVLIDGYQRVAAARAVRSGELSSWSASRVLVPLARANPEHAEALVAAIKGHRVTSRQLLSFFRHYQSANRGLRQKMVDEPVLFFKSLTAKAGELSDQQTRYGRVKQGLKLAKIRLISLIMWPLLYVLV